MSIKYILTINNPHQHYVHVSVSLQLDSEGRAAIFMPSWSPGSYLLREYARLVRKLEVLDSSGSHIELIQSSKGSWSIFAGADKANQNVEVCYEVYCHELTVRTSYVDSEFAFIHGPSVFMGVEHLLNEGVELEVRFPSSWSKISTGLKDVSTHRGKFLYASENYDDFIDCPLQIGCHDTDGFKVQGKEHEVAFYGESVSHDRNLKADIQKIVEHIADYMGDIPYDRYVFMTHLVQGLYGGLEHKNSTALQFCSRGFAKDKDYLNWLCLVSHEYFHTWNVKRIRPKGFGPFDYKKQFDSSMLWLAEGLTSFMDELFVYQCGLASTEEYLELQTKNLNRYYQTHGRKFHSLEVSGFNAWDVLYKPTENSKNSSISYYLKGGIAFFLLNVLLVENNSSTKEFISRLWSWYKKDPSEGMEKEDVLLIIEELAGKFAREQFEEFIETTVEMPIKEYLAKMGLSLEWESKNEIGFGADLEVRESRVYIRAIELDSAAFQSGLNSKDELISINNLRIDSKSYLDLFSNLEENKNYDFQVCRLGKIVNLNAMPRLIGKRIKSIKVENAALLEKFLIREIK